MGYRRFDDREARDEQIRIVHQATSLSLRTIAWFFECSIETVREAIDPELKARRNARRLARYHERKGAS